MDFQDSKVIQDYPLMTANKLLNERLGKPVSERTFRRWRRDTGLKSKRMTDYDIWILWVLRSSFNPIKMLKSLTTLPFNSFNLRNNMPDIKSDIKKNARTSPRKSSKAASVAKSQPEALNNVVNRAESLAAPVEAVGHALEANMSVMGDQITAHLQERMVNTLAQSFSQLSLESAVTEAFDRVFNPHVTYDMPAIGGGATKKQLKPGSSS